MAEVKEVQIGSYYDTQEIKLIPKEGEYVLEVEIIKQFERRNIVEAFDADGNSLGEIVKDKEYFNTKTKEVLKSEQRRVVQYNYDFYYIPTGRCYNMDEVNTTERILKTLWPDVESYRFDECKNSKISDVAFEKLGPLKQNEIIKDTHMISGYKNNYRFFSYNEVCIIGNTCQITSKNKLIDSIQYKKNVEAAILKWPNSKRQIEYLYYINMGLTTLKSRIKPIENLNIEVVGDTSKKVIRFTYSVGEKSYVFNLKLDEKQSTYLYIKEFEDNLAEKNFVVDKNNEEKINTFIENLF